jgi:hypothetical protein
MGLRSFAEAIGSDAVAATTTKLATASSFFMGNLLRFMTSPLET